MQSIEELQWLRGTMRHECGLQRDCKRPNRGPHSTILFHKMFRIMKRHSSRHAPWVSRERNLRSKIRWFTEFCNSHYLSQLATFVIEARAKRFTVRSCHSCYYDIEMSSNWSWESILNKWMKPYVAALARIWGPRRAHHIWQWRVHSGFRHWVLSEESVMILPQVHLRKPCYDFYFL